MSIILYLLKYYDNILIEIENLAGW